MKIGMVGCGKLGLPVAVCMAMRGHDVMGYDLDASRMTYGPYPYDEAGPDGTGDFNTYLGRFASGVGLPDAGLLSFGSLKKTVQHADIVFVAVQTPHDPLYEGITPLPDERVDFDYSYLKTACQQIDMVLERDKPVVIISTCLPGTIRREILPVFGDGRGYGKVVYNPFFIAMGTVMRDFLRPEFVLVGVEDDKAAETVREFYATIYKMRFSEWKGEGFPTPPICMMRIEEAELTKVAYNTAISTKISVANTIMEICERMDCGMNCDVVTETLKLGTDRIVSPAYMSGGMGDGGGCHPRDNIALSWLARELEMGFDWFEAAMLQRERQARWFADMLLSYGMPIGIAGIEFKPGTNLTTGSHAVLVKNLLHDKNVAVRTRDGAILHGDERIRVWLIGCKHPEYATMKWPKGSVILDPHRYIPAQEGVEVVYVGAPNPQDAPHDPL